MIQHCEIARRTHVWVSEAIPFQKFAQHYVIVAVECHVQQVWLHAKRRRMWITVKTAEEDQYLLMILNIQGVFFLLKLIGFEFRSNAVHYGRNKGKRVRRDRRMSASPQLTYFWVSFCKSRYKIENLLKVLGCLWPQLRTEFGWGMMEFPATK